MDVSNDFDMVNVKLWMYPNDMRSSVEKICELYELQDLFQVTDKDEFTAFLTFYGVETPLTLNFFKIAQRVGVKATGADLNGKAVMISKDYTLAFQGKFTIYDRLLLATDAVTSQYNDYLLGVRSNVDWMLNQKGENSMSSVKKDMAFDSLRILPKRTDHELMSDKVRNVENKVNEVITYLGVVSECLSRLNEEFESLQEELLLDKFSNKEG